MIFVKIYTIPLLSLFILALPASASITKRSDCLTRAESNDIIARWTSLAIHIDPKVADETVTEDFNFFSDSQDFLEGLPYGSVTGIPAIKNKTDLIQQQIAAQAPGTPVIPLSFTILLSTHNCNEIIFHWRFMAKSAGNDPNSTDKPGDPVAYAGLDWLILAKGSKLIKTAYSEWNNGEYLYDLGIRTCFQKGNASACS